MNIEIICLIAAAICAFAVIFAVIRLRKSNLPIDGLEFEQYCADILNDNGFEDVELTPASGDFGVDILASKDGVTYAFQCKYYSNPVGTKAVQEIYSGRDYYRRMVGVVITNSTYTRNAAKLAQVHNIMLWDGKKLEHMAK